MKLDRKAFNDMRDSVARGMRKLAFADESAMAPEQIKASEDEAMNAMEQMGVQLEDVESEMKDANKEIDGDIQYLEELKKDPARTEAEIKEIDMAIEKANNAKQELETLKTLVDDFKAKFPAAPVAEEAPVAPEVMA